MFSAPTNQSKPVSNFKIDFNNYFLVIATFIYSLLDIKYEGGQEKMDKKPALMYKGLVVGVIVLFVGASITSIVSANIKQVKNNEVLKILNNKLKEIVKDKNQSSQEVLESIEKIESRNIFLKFLIGPNYNGIENLKQEVEKNKTRIQNLSQIINQLENEGEKSLIQEQIQLLEEENTKLQEMIQQEEETFSLFGWLVKLF